MKLKTSAIILIIASSLVILSNYEIIDTFKSFPIYAFGRLLLPIALLFFGISFLKDKSAVTNLVEEQNNENPSVGDWLIIFFITVIPFVGLVFLIVWTNDDKRIVRKNYAKATLIWQVIVFVIFILFFWPNRTEFFDIFRN
jgi:hypothetical protein